MVSSELREWLSWVLGWAWLGWVSVVVPGTVTGPIEHRPLSSSLPPWLRPSSGSPGKGARAGDIPRGAVPGARACSLCRGRPHRADHRPVAGMQHGRHLSALDRPAARGPLQEPGPRPGLESDFCLQDRFLPVPVRGDSVARIHLAGDAPDQPPSQIAATARCSIRRATATA